MAIISQTYNPYINKTILVKKILFLDTIFSTLDTNVLDKAHVPNLPVLVTKVLMDQIATKATVLELV